MRYLDPTVKQVDDSNIPASQSTFAPPPLPHVAAKTPKEDFLWRVDKASLPRATAYCTADGYNMDLLLNYLTSRKAINGTDPKRFDEGPLLSNPVPVNLMSSLALYTPYRLYSSEPPDQFSNYATCDVVDLIGAGNVDANDASGIYHRRSESIPGSHVRAPHVSNLNDMDFSGSYSQVTAFQEHPPPGAVHRGSFRDLDHMDGGGADSDEHGREPEPVTSMPAASGYPDSTMVFSYKALVRKVTVPELFFFDYGVVVMWGLSEEEELMILKEIRPFEVESIEHSDVEAERFHYLYSRQQQARIYNDIVTLISPNSSTMVKLTISHAFAQSVKLTLFEGLIEETIESTKSIPTIMAETGKIHMPRKAINQKIGQLFIMRINVNLVSNVLDTPEIFWSEPSFEPL
ncbi:hypothetical protein HK101_005673 [Irineochytrium annulatum]|nr:hypothetical protein HK101_005673 [Irineochytrium annulatum]